MQIDEGMLRMKLSISKISKGSFYYFKLFMLIAAEIILAFSVFGYISTAPVSMTFMPVPVLIGALFLGPKEGMLLGAIFGLTSMWKASLTAVVHADIIFSPFASGNPIGSIILSLVVRIAFGLVAGILFNIVKEKCIHKKIWIFIASVAANIFHTVFADIILRICFPDVRMDIGINTVISTSICWIITALILLALYVWNESAKAQAVKARVRSIEVYNTHLVIPLGIIAFVLSVVAVAWSLVYHFCGNAQVLLKKDNIVMTSQAYYDFGQLSLQFMLAVVALSAIVAVIIILFAKYSIEVSRKSELDEMTGIYNRGAMVRLINAQLSGKKRGYKGTFLMIDVDNFKGVNDSYGHLCGDEVLIEVARILERIFRDEPIIGRLGGDEFAVFAIEEFSENRINEIAYRIIEAVNKVELLKVAKGEVTCSIGIAVCKDESCFEQIYEIADKAMYCSKQSGKNTVSHYPCKA